MRKSHGYVSNSSFGEIKINNFALSIVVLSCHTLLCFIRNKFVRNLACEIENLKKIIRNWLGSFFLLKIVKTQPSKLLAKFHSK